MTIFNNNNYIALLWYRQSENDFLICNRAAMTEKLVTCTVCDLLGISKGLKGLGL